MSNKSTHKCFSLKWFLINQDYLSGKKVIKKIFLLNCELNEYKLREAKKKIIFGLVNKGEDRTRASTMSEQA